MMNNNTVLVKIAPSSKDMSLLCVLETSRQELDMAQIGPLEPFLSLLPSFFAHTRGQREVAADGWNDLDKLLQSLVDLVRCEVLANEAEGGKTSFNLGFDGSFCRVLLNIGGHLDRPEQLGLLFQRVMPPVAQAVHDVLAVCSLGLEVDTATMVGLVLAALVRLAAFLRQELGRNQLFLRSVYR